MCGNILLNLRRKGHLKGTLELFISKLVILHKQVCV